MKIALISLTQVWEDKAANKRRIKEIAGQLQAYHPDWVIFPEMTLTGFTMSSSTLSEDMADSGTIHFFSSLARELDCYISFGVIIASTALPTNNLITVNRNGEMICAYEKIHPFTYAGETDFYKAGTALQTADIKGASVGMSICYDLRFPEIFQALSRQTDIIVNIANWPQKRVMHWRTLLKARAIENQVFFIGVNRIGVDGNGHGYEKSSMIYSPNGDECQVQQVSDEIDIFEINPADVAKYRQGFPVKNDRQEHLYKTL